MGPRLSRREFLDRRREICRARYDQRHAATYDRVWGQVDPTHAECVSALVAMTPPGGELLDAGAGSRQASRRAHLHCRASHPAGRRTPPVACGGEEVIALAIGVQVTIDCADPQRLSEFWAAALGYQLEPPPPGYDSWEQWATERDIPPERWNDFGAVVDPDGRGPRLFFQRVPEPKTVKNRVHLDVNTGRGVARESRRAHVAGEAQRLVGLGATEVRTVDEPNGYHIVMLDPEGNEFCLQ